MTPPIATPAKQQMSSRRHIFVAIVMVGLFWALTKWLAGLAGLDADPGEAERSSLRLKTLSALRTEENTKLESFAWVDRPCGSVQIPIDLAMKLVLPDLRANKPKPAYPIATPQKQTGLSALPFKTL